MVLGSIQIPGTEYYGLGHLVYFIFLCFLHNSGESLIGQRLLQKMLKRIRVLEWILEVLRTQWYESDVQTPLQLSVGSIFLQ